jgi:hypothetical protein
MRLGRSNLGRRGMDDRAWHRLAAGHGGGLSRRLDQLLPRSTHLDRSFRAGLLSVRPAAMSGAA